VLLLAGCGRSSVVRPATSTFAPAATVVPAGTLVTAQLVQPLSTARNRVGDLFVVELLDPVVDAAGRERLGRGAVLQGRIAGLGASTLAGRPATFALSLVGVRSGEGLRPVPLEVVDGGASLGSSWRQDLAALLFGAAVGTGAGLAIDRDRSAVVVGSALVGAATGALGSVVFGLREATLPAGALLELRTTQDWE